MIREPEEYRPGRAEKHYRPDKADNSGENLMDNICNYVKHSDNHYTVEQDLSLVK